MFSWLLDMKSQLNNVNEWNNSCGWKVVDTCSRSLAMADSSPHHCTQSLAKHSCCYFLNITASSIMSKWLRGITTNSLNVAHTIARTEPGQALGLLLPEYHSKQHHVQVAGRCQPSRARDLLAGQQATAVHYFYR